MYFIKIGSYGLVRIPHFNEVNNIEKFLHEDIRQEDMKTRMYCEIKIIQVKMSWSRLPNISLVVAITYKYEDGAR